MTSPPRVGIAPITIIATASMPPLFLYDDCSEFSNAPPAIISAPLNTPNAKIAKNAPLVTPTLDPGLPLRTENVARPERKAERVAPAKLPIWLNLPDELVFFRCYVHNPVSGRPSRGDGIRSKGQA
jgi:hypothetical protein